MKEVKNFMQQNAHFVKMKFQEVCKIFFILNHISSHQIMYILTFIIVEDSEDSCFTLSDGLQ
jgi:hypothetical protein